MKVESYKFGTPEQRAFIKAQPSDKQIALWKKMYREWMRDAEKKDWEINKPIFIGTSWLEEYEFQKDTRTYKKLYGV